MSVSDSERHLDPEYLDPETMDKNTYHAVVGPALQAAAQVAAQRGHPTLHDDMPAMLALIDMIGHLAERHSATYPRPDTRMLDQAATGACVMVFQEAGMPGESIGQCLAALDTAYRQLRDHEVLDPARPFIAMAASHLDDDEREPARHCLEQATQRMIAAIEAWQAQTH